MIGSRIREARELRGMSQKELAEKISKKIGKKLSVDAVGSYEREKRKPPYDTLVAIADVLGVSVDYLTGRSDVLCGQQAEDDSEEFASLVTAMFRAQGRLTKEERERLIKVLKAGWPELFEERAE
ncbi:MAG: helix-turn-helix transcriptional regulator [Clostridia bacterium]|nr:helix-turn-helix transcriptional regulator [Clostridia bacterium]